MATRSLALFALLGALLGAPALDAAPRHPVVAASSARRHHDAVLRAVCALALASVLGALWSAQRRLARRMRYERAEAWLREDSARERV